MQPNLDSTTAPSTNSVNELDDAIAAVDAAERNYFSDSSARNWAAVERAKSLVSQIEARQRAAENIATEQAANERKAEKAAKRAKYDELITELGQQESKVEALAKRIADAILVARDMVLIEENALVDESHALYWAATALAEELGLPTTAIPGTLSPYTCSPAACNLVVAGMPDGTLDPFFLSKYAGKYW